MIARDKEKGWGQSTREGCVGKSSQILLLNLRKHLPVTTLKKSQQYLLDLSDILLLTGLSDSSIILV